MPFNEIVPDGHEDLRDSWAHFRQVVDDVAGKVGAYRQDAWLDILAEDDTLLGQVLVADFLRKFGRITWSLTLEGFGNGGVGAIRSVFRKKKKPTPENWTAGDAALHVDGFARYYRDWNEQGLYYLALHETSHVSLLGLRMQDACWRLHEDRHGVAANYANSEPWTFNEQVANGIALQLAATIGFPIIPAPTYGRPPALLAGLDWS
jgi:hypothetical protein